MLSRCLKVSFCLQVKMWRVLAITDWPCKWTTGSSTLGNHTWWHKTTSRWKVCIFDTGSKPIWFNLGPRAEADHTPHLSTESSGVHRVVLMRSYCTWFISTLLRDDYKFLGSKNWILWSPIYFAHVANVVQKLIVSKNSRGIFQVGSCYLLLSPLQNSFSSCSSTLFLYFWRCSVLNLLRL